MENLVAKDINAQPDTIVGDVTVKSYTTDKVEGEDISFAVWYPLESKNCPVILFAHGYGGNSQSHAPLASELAAEGYVVIVPDSEGNDGFLGIFTFLMFATPLNRVSVDGKTLQLALDYVKIAAASAEDNNKSPLSNDKVDLNSIIPGGFSMGSVEAINFASKLPSAKALLLVSPSVNKLGTYSWRIAPKNLIETAKGIQCPTLLVTSDNDAVACGAFSFHEGVFPNSTLVNVKSGSLNLECPNTKRGTSWTHFLGISGKLSGLNDHFALACEAGSPTHHAILPFLKNVLEKGAAGDLGIEGSEWLAPNVMKYSKIYQYSIFGSLL